MQWYILVKVSCLKYCIYIVAELSANHGNSLELALKTVSAAKSAGADAIKLQTYTADSITFNHKSEIFKINQGTVSGW